MQTKILVKILAKNENVVIDVKTDSTWLDVKKEISKLEGGFAVPIREQCILVNGYEVSDKDNIGIDNKNLYKSITLASRTAPQITFNTRNKKTEQEIVDENYQKIIGYLQSEFDTYFKTHSPKETLEFLEWIETLAQGEQPHKGHQFYKAFKAFDIQNIINEEFAIEKLEITEDKENTHSNENEREQILLKTQEMAGSILQEKIKEFKQYCNEKIENPEEISDQKEIEIKPNSSKGEPKKAYRLQTHREHYGFIAIIRASADALAGLTVGGVIGGFIGGLIGTFLFPGFGTTSGVLTGIIIASVFGYTAAGLMGGDKIVNLFTNLFKGKDSSVKHNNTDDIQIIHKNNPHYMKGFKLQHNENISKTIIHTETKKPETQKDKKDKVDEVKNEITINDDNDDRTKYIKHN